LQNSGHKLVNAGTTLEPSCIPGRIILKDIKEIGWEDVK
jgi:hypothetical protein